MGTGRGQIRCWSCREDFVPGDDVTYYAADEMPQMALVHRACYLEMVRSLTHRGKTYRATLREAQKYVRVNP